MGRDTQKGPRVPEISLLFQLVIGTRMSIRLFPILYIYIIFSVCEYVTFFN